MAKKVLVVFGTRPEAIKMAPVVLELLRRRDTFSVSTCVTAQHRNMLDQVMSAFDLSANYDLNIMQQGQDLYDVTSKVVLGMRGVLREVDPDIVLVHGDTTTSMAAALGAFYEKIPVGHVEAGLRSKLRYSPFPEEMNRVITGRIATYHFCPTVRSKENLERETLGDSYAFVTGNTAIDALMLATNRLQSSVGRPRWFSENARGLLVTAHRRENFGVGIENICDALKIIVQQESSVEVLYPVHLNPNISDVVRQKLGKIDRVRLVDPVEYFDFVCMMNDADIILTDSGGVQEEAPSLGKPVLVMRDCTERPEAVEAGTVKLVGTDVAKIVDGVRELLNDRVEYEKMARTENPYGDGQASRRIVSIMEHILAGTPLVRIHDLEYYSTR